MDERTYFISEVSRMVGVEPHVLRYWEEELGLEIHRNSQGKRCYTEWDVEMMRKAKYWKDKGMQLKAVRELLDRGEDAGYSMVVVEKTSDPMQKFEQILDGVVERALERNNDRLLEMIEEALQAGMREAAAAENKSKRRFWEVWKNRLRRHCL